MAMKMATTEKAKQLLEDLRSTSWDPALKGICRVRDILCFGQKKLVSLHRRPYSHMFSVTPSI